MSKPSIAVLQQLVKLNEKIKSMQLKRSEIYKQLLDKYGENTFCYDLDGKVADKKYGKIKITDNRAKLGRGETIWKSTPVTDSDVDASYVKNKPKEMK